MIKNTTRRSILTGAAAIPAAAMACSLPASTDESTFDQLAAELTAAGDRHDKVLNALEIAEKAMFGWAKRDPKPTIRESTVGTNAQYDAWFLDRSLFDPNADLRAAMAEHQTAMAAWNKRKAAAQARCGYDAVHAAEGLVCDEIAGLINRLSLMPASTTRGLRTKAALAEKFGDADLAWSVIDDLNGVPGASAA